ncbi:MAG: serine hydrolase domain-containing protein [Thermoanaerobaculia bacterium]
MKTSGWVIGGVLAAGLLAWPASAVSPSETAGLSAERLSRITQTVQRSVDDGRIAGAVTFVSRGGRVVHFEATGRQDVERGVPMQKETIFRIASMSKAVTTVAALILMEEGRLLLTDPVSKYLLAFKKTVVLAPPAPGAGADAPLETVPAKREITIRDLMTHTSGLGYGMGRAEALYKAAGAYYWYFADKDEPIGRVVDRMAGLPFDAQPGENWVYGFSADVLGRVVEVISGMDLDTFFRKRIFDPIGMKDTCFFLPKEKAGRLATVYGVKPSGGIERVPDGGRGQGDYVDGPRKCFSGGAGLLSTASDYARFLQMLLNGGALDGVRILSPKTVELATANQVGSLYEGGRFGFGLGFEIVEDVGRAGRPGSPGSYGWGSAYYSRYFVDPKEQLVAIFFSQLLPAGGLDLQDKFRVLVYSAIVGPPPAERPPRGN